MSENERWSLYGAQWSQLVATGGKWDGADNGANKLDHHQAPPRHGAEYRYSERRADRPDLPVQRAATRGIGANTVAWRRVPPLCEVVHRQPKRDRAVADAARAARLSRSHREGSAPVRKAATSRFTDSSCSTS